MKGFGLNPYNQSHAMKIRPFFNYFGGKYRATRLYPRPSCNTIIEPFAGAAGYSTRYWQRKVILFDIDECVCGVWDFLIHASSADILQLPARIETVDDIKGPQEAKWLVGYWLGLAARPKRSATKNKKFVSEHPQSFWGAQVRDRLAIQCQYIRHWRIKQASYDSIPNRSACWFIDPPYSRAGAAYKHHAIDYIALGRWCQERRGQVIVCEEEGADWLPFRKLGLIKSMPLKSGKSKSPEAIWYKRQ